MNIGRAKHYTKIKQASFIDDKSIQLSFTPKIVYEQIFGCAICGNIQGELVKRSIIPHYLKTLLPEQKKKEISGFINVPICKYHLQDIDCLSSFYVKQLLEELNIENKDNDIYKVKLYRENLLANKIIHKNTENVIKNILQIPENIEITVDKLDEYIDKTKNHGDTLMEYILENNLVDNFIENWKILFIENMNPTNYNV
jgi:hypothetical protein